MGKLVQSFESADQKYPGMGLTVEAPKCVLSSVKRSDITTHYNHIAGVFEL
jgi:hypothetical protein